MSANPVREPWLQSHDALVAALEVVAFGGGEEPVTVDQLQAVAREALEEWAASSQDRPGPSS